MLRIKKIVLAIALLFIIFSMSSFLFSPAKATTDCWATLEPMPTARSGLGVAAVDEKIYAIGGYNGSYLTVNEMYDKVTDTWTTKKPMPTPRHSFGIAVYENKVYLFGGSIGPTDKNNSGYTGITEVYDPSTDTWETKTSMPTPRSSLSASTVNNKIYLMGGIVHTNQYQPYYNSTNIVEVYDPETDTWTTENHLPNILHDYTSTVVENEIYLIGGKVTVAGIWHNPITSNSNQIYGPENDTWIYGESMSSSLVSGAAAATTGLLAPKRIYVLGGWNGDEIHGTNLTRIYDPENDEWTQGTPMSTNRYGMGIAVVNDELYVIGGATGSGNLGDEVTRLAINERYTPFGYVPEFPSWVILPLFLTATVVVAVYKKKLTKTAQHSY